MKAMILAAGRGERLIPLTDRIPKPLIEAGGKPLVVWHMERLAAAGFREVVINLSHLGEQIERALGDGSAWDLSIAYSRESAPLESAGGLAFARARLGEAPFLLVNGDVYCEIGFAALRARACASDLAHLVLVPNPAFHPQGDFSLAAGRVGNGAAPRYTYAGVSVISPQLLDGVTPGARAPLAPLLRGAAQAGRVTGELYEGVWTDVGTADRLAGLNARLRAADAGTRMPR